MNGGGRCHWRAAIKEGGRMLATAEVAIEERDEVLGKGLRSREGETCRRKTVRVGGNRKGLRTGGGARKF